MSDVMRLLDANSNRAREGLRVMEDVARFVLDDMALCAEIKSIRHGLREALAALPGGVSALLAHRDTPGDVGTRVTTPAGAVRTGTRDLALAASRRVTEALRAIEEGAKVTAPTSGAAQAVEALRYRAYDAERRVALALGAGRAGFAGWRVCVLITESLCAGRSWLGVAAGAMEGGADCVQLREKHLDDRELLARAKALVEAARAFGAAVIVNDRPDIALLAGATGAHVGWNDLSVEEIRRLAGDDLLVGVSVSTMEQARAERLAGADCCGVGAMFATTTKEKDAIAGPSFLRDYLHAAPPFPPALAIGGITPGAIAELVSAAGGRRFGVAVSSCVCAAPAPALAVADILSALDANERSAHELTTGDERCQRNSGAPLSTTD